MDSHDAFKKFCAIIEQPEDDCDSMHFRAAFYAELAEEEGRVKQHGRRKTAAWYAATYDEIVDRMARWYLDSESKPMQIMNREGGAPTWRDIYTIAVSQRPAAIYSTFLRAVHDEESQAVRS